MSQEPVTTTFTTMVFRYSQNPSAMIDFLTDLGMRVAISSDLGFAELHAGAGRVLVHHTRGAVATDAPSGLTCLNLAVEDVASAAEDLERHGFSVRTWDESYGHQGSIASPGDVEITLNEEQHDLYGYQGHDPSGADDRLVVTAVRASFDREQDVAFFERLGFVPEPDGDEWWQAMRAPGSAGVIGLHKPAATDRAGWPTNSDFGVVATVRLGFETTEPLDELAERLQAMGYDAKVVDNEVRSVHVSDPDGQHLEIHPRP